MVQSSSTTQPGKQEYVLAWVKTHEFDSPCEFNGRDGVELQLEFPAEQEAWHQSLQLPLAHSELAEHGSPTPFKTGQ